MGELQTGKITEEQLTKLEQTACPTCGSCSGMFTANSMNCLCEALGIALPGNGTILAVSKEREALYDRAARAIVKLVEADLKPRDIATLEAFDNALMLDVAMGGSTNTVLHTLAIAREAGIAYDIARIDGISRRDSLRVQSLAFLRLPRPGRASRRRHPHHPRRTQAHGRSERELQNRHRQNHRREHRRMGRALGETASLGPRPPAWPEPRPSWSIPNDKLGPAARTASGNLAPKPMLFFPGDERAITLWRLAAAFNNSDAASAACLFTDDAEFQVDDDTDLERPRRHRGQDSRPSLLNSKAWFAPNWAA